MRRKRQTLSPSQRPPGRRRGRALPVLNDRTVEAEPARRSYGRWRALCLSLVYLAFAAHIVHWKMTGRTLAPLELNEVMYTLELGIITAGFLLMALLVLGTLVFGRFFCSWACHIVALQDLCGWMLRKLHIRQKPIRSRLLLFVPPLTALYMFVWPQVVRTWENRAFPTFHLAGDADGWASLVTNNFWRNLPGTGVIVLTFVVCGFVIVYLLGSRTFCTYVCPYGAIFGLADRFAPGRIRVTDACQQCGTCTAACTSGIRVHEEVAQHGMIVNPACLKDLDCVTACPQHALHYAFGRPSLMRSFAGGGRFGRLRYDFSPAEELVAAVVFLVVLLSFRGLYGQVPFLLSLALGAIIAFLAVAALRLLSRPHVTLATLSLKRTGRVTNQGWAFVTFVVILSAFVGHSGFIRYHEYRGLRAAAALTATPSQSSAAHRRSALAETAFAHLTLADRWGLLSSERTERSLLAAAGRLHRFDLVETYARRVLARYPFDTAVRFQWGEALVARDLIPQARDQFQTIIAQWTGAAEEPPPAVASAHHALGTLLAREGHYQRASIELQASLKLDAAQAAVHGELGEALAELGRFDDAIASLREAVRLDPGLARAQYNLGTILAHTARLAEAIPCYEHALADGMDDAELHNNFGFALLRTGDLTRAQDHLTRAVSLDPDNADAHFNLGVLLSSRHQAKLAAHHFRQAAHLDPRYAGILRGTMPE